MRSTLLTAVGDVFLGDSPIRIGHGAGSVLEHGDRGAAAQAIRQLLGPADHHFANVETVLSHVGRRPLSLGSREMRGHPDLARFVAECGWDIVNVANNHIFQHGEGAYRDTVERLQSLGLAVVGCGGDGPSPAAVIESAIGPLTFVGYSLRPEQYHPGREAPYSLPRDEDDLLRQIGAVVEAAGGNLIVSLHWGYEFMDEPSAGQQRLARRICELGARALLGHHPHVVQGLEKHGGSLIAYSLGNFIFDLLDEGSRRSVVLRLRLDEDGGNEAELVPVLIGADCLPQPMPAAEAEAFLAGIEELSRRAAAGEVPSDEELEARMRRYYAEFSRGNYRHFFRNLATYNPIYSGQAILRAVLRRLKLVHDP